MRRAVVDTCAAWLGTTTVWAASRMFDHRLRFTCGLQLAGVRAGRLLLVAPAVALTHATPPTARASAARRYRRLRRVPTPSCLGGSGRSVGSLIPHASRAPAPGHG